MAGNLASKRIARIVAVQVAYQNDIAGPITPHDIDDFLMHYVKQEPEYAAINVRFFKKLANRLFEEVDFAKLLMENIENGRTPYNLPMIGEAIMKVAIIEMIFERTDIPVLLNEYIEIAKSFLDCGAVKFINALLDKISKNVERRCLTEA